MNSSATPIAESTGASDSKSVPAGGPVWRAAIGRCTRLLRKIEPHGQSAVLLSLRLIYGWFFVEAGWGKLMNFGRTTGFFASLGLPAPVLNAGAVAVTELVGGMLLALGVGTRYAATALSIVLSVAYLTAHREDAFQSLSAFTEQTPYPFLVACLVLLAFGAGRISGDGLIRTWRERRRKRIASLDAD
jgi:putative oxidoreductase